MKNFLIFLLFVVLTVGFTWPIPLHMETAIGDLGDPLLNTWILAWDVHQLLKDPLSLFEANIFYPHKSTFAYSEHLFASSLIALPVIAITGKPILGYNAVLLTSFVLAGFGMYCLVLYLTGSKFAGIVSGIIFAFCPYRFDHLSHLQLLTNHWMPFAFLYLHKFFDRKNYKDLLLFTLFFVLQCLSCGYYAVFLSVSIGCILVWFVLMRKVTRRNFAGMLLFILIAGASIYPFYKPYARVQKEMNFVRSLSDVKYYSAHLKNYLSVSSSNHLYKRLSYVFGDHEKNLFPGLLAVFLSAYGFLSWRKRGEFPHSLRFYFIDILIIISIAFDLFILISGGFSFQIGKFHFSAHRLANPVMITVFLFIIRYFLLRHKRPFFLCEFFRRYPDTGESQVFYLFLLIFVLILSLGPNFAPYRVLYKFIPPFRSLRVAARWGAMVVFSISVLAGFGVRRFLAGSPLLRRKVICALIPVILIVEYSCFPLRELYMFPTQVPEVYRWLSRQEGDFALVELPMPSTVPEVYRETRYMYWSTFHWKKLVNGYSGFFPSDYWEINKTMQEFPSEKSIALLRNLGVRYVIVHTAEFRREWWRQMEEILSQGHGQPRVISHIISFGTDHVYEIGKLRN